MKRLLLPSACAATFVLAGCGAVDRLAEEATEEILEEVLEGEGIEDIEFDSDGNTVIIGEDGEKVVISGDGDNAIIEITGADGESIATVDRDGSNFVVDDGEGNIAVGGTELAEGWPSQFPLPDGVSIVTSLRSDSDGKVSFMAQFEGDRSYEDVVAAVKAYGDSPTLEQETRSGDVTTFILGYELDNGAQLSVLLNMDGSGSVDGTIAITDWVE